MALIETITRFGAGRDTWLNVSGGVGNEAVTSLSVSSRAPVGQGIALRMVLQDGSTIPVMNPRLLNANRTERIRLPALFLKSGQYLACYSSEFCEWNMTLTRINAGRGRTNRLSSTPPPGDWSAISAPGNPFEITSVLCVNKTEAVARAGLRFRNQADGSVGCLFLDEPVAPRATARAVMPNYLIRENQWLDVFSTCDCSWIISGVTA